MLLWTLREIHFLIISFVIATANTGYVQAQSAGEYSICSGPNRAKRKATCLVDGDTGWEQGKKWRLESVDTPEYKQHAECAAEVEYARIVTLRVLELMRTGYEVEWTGKKGKLDRHLVRIKVSGGKDLGEILLSEGLAQRWPNDTNPWCE
nr:thermonuclease family protein [uncultured Roseibium sp.]